MDDHTLLIQIDTDSFLTLVTTSSAEMSDEAVAFLENTYLLGAGTFADDTMTGTGSNDVIDGGDGDDSLQGSDGNDTLIAGFGNDTMFGGEGADVFHDTAGSDGQTDGHDKIVGFWSSQDVVVRYNVGVDYFADLDIRELGDGLRLIMFGEQTSLTISFESWSTHELSESNVLFA